MSRQLICILLWLFGLLQQTLAGDPWYCGATPLSPATSTVCPVSAEVSCSGIGATGYCCPSGCFCGWSDGRVGCCQTGDSCSGEVETVTTTVTVYDQTTSAAQTTATPEVVTGTTITLLTGTTTTTAATAYCSTEIASGADLPRTAEGTCGTILIIAGSARIGVPSEMVAMLLSSVLLMIMAL